MFLIIKLKKQIVMAKMVSYRNLSHLWFMKLGPYSQHFIFFVTYKLAQ